MNCHICHKYCNCKTSCNLKIKTMPNRDPNDTSQWAIDPVPINMDPVMSNIYNGGWLCNYEPHQTHNNKICARAFEDRHIIAPYNYAHVIDMESQLKTLDQVANRFCTKQ